MSPLTMMQLLGFGLTERRPCLQVEELAEVQRSARAGMVT